MKRLVSLAFTALAACAPAPPAIPFAGAFPAYAERGSFIVVGDLQRTSLLEAWREQNDPERARVVAEIARERPAFVAMTGDLVFGGASASQWAAFDQLAAPIREAGIPVVAALGNHEYWGGRDGEAHFFARFPHLDRALWYTRAWGPIRLVVLNSNEGDLSTREWIQEQRWFARTLAALDEDRDVRGVLVLAHHPPFTNSTVTGDERHVQEAFLPAFFASKKALALMCGHVHSYERFERRGKTLVVSGGGGGPRAALKTGAARRHADDKAVGPALRDFNFVRMTIEAEGIAAEVRGLPKGGAEFHTMDRFFLRFP